MTFNFFNNTFILGGAQPPNCNVLKVFIWGFKGCLMFQTGVWHLDIDLDMVAGLWFNPYSKFRLSILILKVQLGGCAPPHINVLLKKLKVIKITYYI